MAIYGLDSVASRGGQTAPQASKSLGKNDFLYLLVSQLKAQDPLNPMDSTGFTAQLAQFSSLEEMQNMNATLTNIGASQSILTNSQAVGFIGNRVTVVGDRFQVISGVCGPLQFNLENDAQAVFVKVYDSNSRFIRDIELGELPAGNGTANWDGRDSLGNRVADGVYRYEIQAIDGENKPVKTTTFTQGSVTGVNYKNGIAYLMLDGRQEIPMGNIVEVMAPAEQ
jgi:flagellar basal-body rod modification protein FlgD